MEGHVWALGHGSPQEPVFAGHQDLHEVVVVQFALGSLVEVPDQVLTVICFYLSIPILPQKLLEVLRHDLGHVSAVYSLESLERFKFFH